MKRTRLGHGTLLMVCMLAAGSVAAVAAENLVKNPSFEAEPAQDGTPADWQWAGNSQHVTQALTIDKGRDGKRCARLTCTRLTSGTASDHAMICQLGVPVRSGQTYRLTFWARAEQLRDQVVSVALSDTGVWANCGLQSAFAPGRQWQRYEFLYRGTRNCADKTRFQIWYTSTGTLWLDDVELTEAGTNLYRPGHIIPAGGSANLVPNASFECGPAGWGSAEWDRVTHWGGRMNALFGEIDTKESFQGQCSLRITLTDKTQPVSFFDYYDLYRTPIRAPLAANVGFLEVQPGQAYTLSAYLKADRDRTPCRLAVRQFNGRDFDKAVEVATQWGRAALTFKPTSRWCYVLAGPDLPPGLQATVWVDAVQLERAGEPTAFAPRDAVELGVATDKCGNVFDWSQPVQFRVTVSNGGGAAQTAAVELRLTDFFDREAWREKLSLDVPAGSSVSKLSTAKAGEPLRGFYRLHATLAGDGRPKAPEQTLRLAVIPSDMGKDSRFGMNHAYPWPHLLDLSRKAGLVWVRDWSLKWKDVEPRKGTFSFQETDAQIDRPLAHGLRVLGLLAFPSSPWSSTGAAEAPGTSGYVERRAVVARAPRDMTEFENYVQKTVAHYRGRITWFQVFNEPLYTSYALPRQYGYDGATYARYVQAFAAAARCAKPDCQILAGIGALNDGQIMEDFERFFAAGGLKAIDAVDIHHYPRIRPPEFVEPLLEKLNALMDRHGGRKPLWLTEYGYYADDEPWSVPMPDQGFNQPLASERLQAEYAVRWGVLLLANGADKVFYHAGTCAGINNDSLQGVFYEYGGQTHRIYAAQAVMAHLLTPTCRFVRKLALGPGVRAYLFADASRTLAVIWAPQDAQPRPVRLASEKLVLWDLMGRPQKVSEFTPGETPVYVIGQGLSAQEIATGLR